MPTIYITAPRDDAEGLAARLVEERLAACVNIVQCTSTYRWAGSIEKDDEAILLAKTTADVGEAMMDRIAELHPHDIPCIERFEEDLVHGPFARWRAEVVE